MVGRVLMLLSEVLYIFSLKSFFIIHVLISFLSLSKKLSQGISPTNILAMTFTTAAASEMRDRIGAVAGKAIAKELMISTFHSFSLQLCRSYAEKYVHCEIANIYIFFCLLCPIPLLIE